MISDKEVSEQDGRIRQLEQLYRKELTLLGEDPEREGLLKTPLRVAKSML